MIASPNDCDLGVSCHGLAAFETLLLAKLFGVVDILDFGVEGGVETERTSSGSMFSISYMSSADLATGRD